MAILKITGTVAAVAVLTTTLAQPAGAQAAEAATVLRDTTGANVGTASLTQTGAGVLLKLSLHGLAPGEHAIHVHNVGKCDAPAFDSAGPHFNPGNSHHGMMAGAGHAGDMPNLHVPPGGTLELELVNTAIALDKDNPNSVFHPGGTSLVIHSGKDDYTSDPAGNSGNRVACGVISETPTSVGRSPSR